MVQQVPVEHAEHQERGMQGLVRLRDIVGHPTKLPRLIGRAIGTALGSPQNFPMKPARAKGINLDAHGRSVKSGGRGASIRRYLDCTHQNWRNPLPSRPPQKASSLRCRTFQSGILAAKHLSGWRPVVHPDPQEKTLYRELRPVQEVWE
jgi:hypothetical protein